MVFFYDNYILSTGLQQLQTIFAELWKNQKCIFRKMCFITMLAIILRQEKVAKRIAKMMKIFKHKNLAQSVFKS